ncbi:MAG: molybdopterin oxidoreductase family protein [Pseudomonadota bacterium]|nr:dehydrogenase [Pseudomonadales bacterium]MDY6922149.1 molybdopterin oxidoreductase family protein [Pseudomonadota bacterium]
MNASQVHYRACHLCEAMCGLEVVTRDQQVVSIKGDPKDPLSAGYVCPKATAIADIHEDPDRIRQPLRREGGQWHPIAWEEAFDLVAERLVTLQEQHGNNAVGLYLGNPVVHNWGMMTHGANFFKPLRTRNRFSATSVDQLPHQLVCYWMYGHQVQVPVPDIDRTDYLIIVGGNPMASNGSIWSVPGFRQRAKALRQRGGKLVVLDPRRSETAAIADQHQFVVPGTDAFLLLAMAQQIFSNDWVRPGHLKDHLADLDQARAAVADFTPELAEQRSGVPAATVRQLAHDLAHAKRGAIYGRMGISVQQFGAVCQWAIQLLNIITGQLDVPGGYSFSLPAVDMVRGPGNKPGHFNAWQSRVRGLPEFGGELPVSVLAEEIMTPGEGQIRALITGAGNPVLSTPNGTQLERALETLDFMVSIDFYINETTRFADVILPPTSPLEHDHYDLALLPFAVRNVAKYSPAVFPKPESARHDWEILAALGERVSQRKGVAPLPLMPPTMILDMGLRSGPYADRLSLAALQAEPHGVDLGPHQSQFPQRLVHEDKMIRCAPEPILADLQRLLQQEPAPEDMPLRLIGRRHVRSNNSWMHNYQRLVKGKPRCQLLMHPQDVAALSLEDGQSVQIRSRTGALVADLLVSEEMMPGVVSLPHGWGHNRPGIQARVAREHAGVSVNDLTDEQYLDELSGNAALNGVPVAVSAA